MEDIHDVILGLFLAPIEDVGPQHPDAGSGSVRGRVNGPMDGRGLAQQVVAQEPLPSHLPLVRGEIGQDRRPHCIPSAGRMGNLPAESLLVQPGDCLQIVPRHDGEPVVVRRGKGRSGKRQVCAWKRHPLVVGVKVPANVGEEDGELGAAGVLGLLGGEGLAEQGQHAAGVALAAELVEGEDAGDAVGGHVPDGAGWVADDGALAVCFYGGEDGAAARGAVGVGAGGIREDPRGEAAVFGELVGEEVLFSVDVGLGC